mmetsp:Transcript_86764/g.243080  ORF Transcript_86764/g.243080 Transcript_86764/m.243080 type:complete len:645 (+) Transcript_86764:528-2462(+)
MKRGRGDQETEEHMKDVKAAMKAAQAAGVEGKGIEDAEQYLKDLKASGKAQEKLKQAIAEKDVARLRKAIAKAEEANVPKKCLDEARQVLAEEEPKEKAREQLEGLRNSTAVGPLKEAIAKAKKVGLRKSELEEFEALLAKLAQRENAAELVKGAIESRDIAKLKDAIQQATDAGVEKELVDKAKEVLSVEEPKQKAREQIAEAREAGTIDALRAAIQAAEVAGLAKTEYEEAAAQLHKEEEKERMLAAVNQAVLDCKDADFSNIDSLREHKERLGSVLQAAIAAGVPEANLSEADSRRKKLHNAIEDLKGSIRVFCRIRPLSGKEKEQGDTTITDKTSSMTLQVDNKDQKETFGFDAVFAPGTQEEVFEDCADLVQSSLDGYNVTMFAYGQTGAGKTFTMYGVPGMEGTTPRVIKELFRLVEAGKGRFTYTVGASMLELYRNDLVDLLSKGQGGNSKSKLNIKQDKSGAINVENLTEEKAENAEDLSAILERGSEQRSVAATAMNSESSRSHLVFMVKIVSVNKESGQQLKGKILMCDLAGSERLKKSQVTEDMQKEAIEINKSLTALGDVIEALTKKTNVIPYRNHKLTQLMQDSLGGTAKTLMFVNCSPANSNADETLMSLKYATRAKKITNTAVRRSGAH